VSGTGRPVIQIPGLGCSGDVWTETIAHLASKGAVQTHVIDVAGFGGRPAIDVPLNATVRTELARYIRDRKLDHPVIIGHSMGGFLALWLAASEPDLVGPTVVVDAAPALGINTDPQVASQLADMWRTSSDSEFAQETRDFYGGMANNAQRLAPVIAEAGRSDRRAFADAFVELFSTDLRADMRHVRAPVLVVLAETSPVDEIKSQTDPIPHHEVVVLAGTKHFVFFDDPAAFYRVVDAFLAAHP
jgi:pimeloyl-ACP methyl ester carboxylesterase